MKKLLIVSRSTIYHNKSGGMETQLANLIKALSLDYEITVLTSSKLLNGQKINIVELIDGVTYIFLKGTVPGEYGFNLYETIFWQIPIKHNIGSLNKNFRRVAALYYKKHLFGKYSVILSQSSAASLFKISKSTKLVLIYHGTTLNELKSRIKGAKGIKDYIRVLFLDTPSLLFEYFITNTLLFLKTSKIVLVSNLIYSDFKSQYPLFYKKTTIIENAIDTTKFNSHKKNKKFTVIYFGRIDFEKGLYDFVEVAKNLPDFDFIVYGTGTDKVEFEKLLLKEKLTNLKYFGEVNNEKLAKYLSTIHVFLFLTKRKEGFPMSIIESLSCGTCVVTTINLELINPDIPYKKVKSVAESVEILKELSKNKSQFEKISKSSRQFVLDNYSLKKLRDSYKKILK